MFNLHKTGLISCFIVFLGVVVWVISVDTEVNLSSGDQPSAQRTYEPKKNAIDLGQTSARTNNDRASAMRAGYQPGSGRDRNGRVDLSAFNVRRINRPLQKLNRVVKGYTPKNRLNSPKDSIRQILSAEGGSARKRVEDLKSLEVINFEDSQLIIKTLNSPQIPAGISPSSWNWVVDQLMGTLREHGANPIEVTQQLAQVFHNTSNDIVTRDYALQHLGHMIDEGGDLTIIKDAMKSGVELKSGTIAGTALLGLTQNDRISTTENGMDAMRIVTDPSYSIESRATALQVAAKNDEPGVIKYAEKLTNAQETPKFLKLSATSILKAHLSK